MNVKQIPNIITCLRMLLVLPVLGGLLQGYYALALYAFLAAGFSDALDGFLARHYGWISRFGAIADPLADKLLLMSSFTALAWLGFVPVWLLLVVVGRDLWIMVGVVCYHFLIGQPDFAPRLMSKVNTFLQILLVILLLLQLSLASLPDGVITVVMYSVFITSLVSFADYTWVWGKRALRQRLLSHHAGENKSCPPNCL